MTDFLGELFNEMVGSDMIGNFTGWLSDLEWKRTMMRFVVRQSFVWTPDPSSDLLPFVLQVQVTLLR